MVARVISFTGPDGNEVQERLDSNTGVIHVKEGFWINEEFEIAPVFGRKFWIPPSRINYVKLEEE